MVVIDGEDIPKAIHSDADQIPGGIVAAAK